MLLAELSSDNDSGTSHVKPSLLLIQNTPAVLYETTRLCWLFLHNVEIPDENKIYITMWSFVILIAFYSM